MPTWEGLDALRELMVKNWTKVFYATLSEKDTGKEDRISRFDVRRDDGSEINEGEAGIESLLTTIRARTERHTVGLPGGRFRVGLYGKGSVYLESTTIKIDREEAPAPPPAPAAPEGLAEAMGYANSSIPPLGAFQGAQAESMNTLAAAYGQFHKEIVFPFLYGASNLLLRTAEATQRPLLAQIDRLQDLTGELSRELGAIRRVEIDATTGAKVSEAEAKARGEVATTAITEGVGLARAIFAMKAGLPPALIDTLTVVADDAELSKALSDPRVKRMLEDPDNRKQLVELLIGAAAEKNPDEAQKGDKEK